MHGCHQKKKKKKVHVHLNIIKCSIFQIVKNETIPSNKIMEQLIDLFF